MVLEANELSQIFTDPCWVSYRVLPTVGQADYCSLDSQPSSTGCVAVWDELVPMADVAGPSDLTQ